MKKNQRVVYIYTVYNRIIAVQLKHYKSTVVQF